MQFEIVHPGQYVVPQLLDERGILKLLPASVYDTFDRNGLRLFCHNHARYGLPTTELVTWLREYIAGRSCLEIGSGAGDLAHHLGVRATDNRMQEWPEIKMQYAMTGQPVIPYPVWMEELDAIDAVQKYKPDVVLASWVTEWIDPAKLPPPHGGNVFGVKENLIVTAGDIGLSHCNPTYILIGNDATHGKKQIMSRKHERFYFPFLKSRAKFANLNCVYVWHGE